MWYWCGVFWLGGLVFWWDYKLWVYYGGFNLKARDLNLHVILGSQLVGAIVGVSFGWMLHAAWVSIIAFNRSEWWYGCSLCTVWVSHHINIMTSMTLKHWCYPICLWNPICIVLVYDNCVIWIWYRICVNFNNVCSVWIVVYKYYIIVLQSYYMVYTVCVSGIYISGGSYSSAYVPPQVCIFIVLMVYTYVMLFAMCTYIFLYTHTPNITLYQLY